MQCILYLNANIVKLEFKSLGKKHQTPNTKQYILYIKSLFFKSN